MTNQKASSKEKDKTISLWIIGLILFFIIALWLWTWFVLKDKPFDERGTFGDMFGSVNAIFSGLAFGGIIITIWLQRNKLILQREELRDTRAEFVTQNETLKLQRFENTFFNLLNLHHQIVSAIDHSYENQVPENRRNPSIPQHNQWEAIIIKGRDVFKYLYNEMEKNLKSDDFITNYEDHYRKAHTDFGHYFRNLYRMIKLVEETDFPAYGGDEIKLFPD